ncbi:MAG: DUF3738 domain-containing protein, partial [Vicinamibacterales bacterium]
ADTASTHEQLVTMMKTLLADRFKLATHTEERPRDARRQLVLPVSDNYFCRCRYSKRIPPTTWRDSVMNGRLVA